MGTVVRRASLRRSDCVLAGRKPAPRLPQGLRGSLLRELSLAQILQLFDAKFRGVPYERYHILKSLTYFEDAEAEPMPEMVELTSWNEIKQFFVTEAPGLLRGEH
jgi:hypothetical protein